MGCKSSCRKFGLWADFERLRHVLCSEGTRAMGTNLNQGFFLLLFYNLSHILTMTLRKTLPAKYHY